MTLLRCLLHGHLSRQIYHGVTFIPLLVTLVFLLTLALQAVLDNGGDLAGVPIEEDRLNLECFPERVTHYLRVDAFHLAGQEAL